MTKTAPLYQMPVMTENPCNCHSYNADVGETPNRVMTAPDGKEVCIDECIADTLQHLWNNNIDTLNSCCGHGRTKPSIVLNQSLSKDDANHVRELIRKTDHREFDLLSWHLINV